MQQKLDHLFDRYFYNIADPSEVDEFYKIIDKGDQYELFEQLVDKKLVLAAESDEPGEGQSYPTGAATRMLNNIFAADVDLSEFKQTKQSPKLWLKLAIAAAVTTIICSMGMWFFKQQDEKDKKNSVYTKVAIPPGKSTATLTLANGKKIRLSEALAGKLADEAGIVISKTTDGQVIYEAKSSPYDAKDQYNTLSTSRGETYQLRLPDGSRVWLNAASSLKYTTKLIKNGVRSVQLEGEGYFQVAKDKNHPFIVEINSQKIKVLGTHFNVNGYKDVLKTTLLEGKVSISTLHHKAFLNPGEQSESSIANGIKVKPADTYGATAWKEGFLYFNAEDIVTVMKTLSDWYDIEVSYKGALPQEKFSGNISRNLELGKALKLLSHSNAVHFKIEGRRITVML